MTNENTQETEGKRRLTCRALVRAIASLKRIRFGMSNQPHRWLYLPWKWAHKKSAHGGWFFLSLRTPLEMIVGVENLSRWKNKRAARRSPNDQVLAPKGPQ